MEKAVAGLTDLDSKSLLHLGQNHAVRGGLSVLVITDLFHVKKSWRGRIAGSERIR